MSQRSKTEFNYPKGFLKIEYRTTDMKTKITIYIWLSL